ncbi:hypothetical protein D3C80_1796160 [compost metagenome]
MQFHGAQLQLAAVQFELRARGEFQALGGDLQAVQVEQRPAVGLEQLQAVQLQLAVAQLQVQALRQLQAVVAGQAGHALRQLQRQQSAQVGPPGGEIDGGDAQLAFGAQRLHAQAALQVDVRPARAAGLEDELAVVLGAGAEVL